MVTAAKVSDVLATTSTTAAGSFSVTVTIPDVPAGGKDKIILAAEAVDPGIKLDYFGTAVIAYMTAPAPTSTQPTSSHPSSNNSSTVDTPTAVPAGSGGFAALTSSSTTAVEIGALGAGALLIGSGAVVLVRRRPREH